MKVLVFICFAAVILQIACAASNSWGSRQAGDSLVASKSIVRGAVKYTIQTDTLDYNSPQNQRIVTLVKIVDNAPAEGGNGFISVGGPGQRSAHLYFRSQYSKGLNMYAEIYARRRFK